MTTIIHIVGNGDLGNDIVDLEPRERTQVQARREKELRGAIEQATASDLADMLLRFPPSPPGQHAQRFHWKPIAYVLRALSGRKKPVHILLLGTASGQSGTKTDLAVSLFKAAFERADVKELLERELDLTLDVTARPDGNLWEGTGAEVLREELSKLSRDEPVIVNGVAGATMLTFIAMGVADQLGLDWRLAIPQDGPEAAKAGTVHLVDRHSYPEAPYYWLRSLGYLEAAKSWVEEAAPSIGSALPDDVKHELETALAVIRKFEETPEDVNADDLAVFAAMDMARAGNGAGLVVRAWIEKRYKEILAQDNTNAPCGKRWRSLFEKDSDDPRANMTLGLHIQKARRRTRVWGKKSPQSARWLSKQGRLNEIGIDAVHRGAAPRASDIELVRSVKELDAALPTWITWPIEGKVLCVYACGNQFQEPTIPSRIVESAPKPELRRAVRGAMLAGAAPLEIEFVALHSSSSKSQAVATEHQRSASRLAVHKGWADVPPVVTPVVYGTTSPDSPQQDLMAQVKGLVHQELDNRRPAAVVLVGTGQKPVAYGSLEAARGWCARHAVPLFLQSFVEGSESQQEHGAQFHRIALANDAEKALRQAATLSLSSLDLMSAVRVLSAGDQDMDQLANKVDQLRTTYQEACDTVELDAHADVIVSILQTVRYLWCTADWLARTRLVVVAAEACWTTQRRTRGTTLLREPELELTATRVGTRTREQRRAPLENLARGDLLRLLYSTRNNLVVTHGKLSVKDAMTIAFEDAWVEIPSEMTFDLFLDRLINRLTDDAATFTGITLTSTWFRDFKTVFVDVKKGL